MTGKRVVPKGTIVVVGIWLLLMATTMVVWRSCVSAVAPPQELIGVLRPAPTPIEPFMLIDHNGDVFDKSRLMGKWTLLFFGYTYCPDVCPAALTVMASAYEQLQGKADGDVSTQVLFVSVDPERDTTARLAEYVAYFNRDFIAATGDVAAINALSKQFGAGYIREEETSPGEYLVSHTSAIFLTDPKARLVASFSQPHVPDNIVTQFEQIRAFVGD